MLIYSPDIFSNSNIMLLWQVSALKRCFLLSLQTIVVEETSRNKSAIQTPITDFINKKENHVCIQHNSILTLIKSDTPFFGIDIMYMIYLDVRYFSIVCLSIFYKKPVVKTALTTMSLLYKEVKLLSVRHNLLEIPLFETRLKTVNSCFLYIQQDVTRNNFT